MTSAERMLCLLLSQFYAKPVIKALLETIGEEFDFHEELREEIRTKIWPDVATGSQLDMCGEVVDIGRTVADIVAVESFGFPDHGGLAFDVGCFHRYGETYLSEKTMNDDYYRYAIYSKIKKNTTDCGRQDTIDSLKVVFNVDKIVAVNAGNAKMRIGIGRTVTAEELRLINGLDLIIRGAGIGLVYFYCFEAGSAFGFSRGGENPGGFLGFDEGVFSRVLEVEGSLV